MSREDIDNIGESFLRRKAVVKNIFFIGGIIIALQLGFYALNYIGR